MTSLTVRSEEPANSAISTVDLSTFGPGKGNHGDLKRTLQNVGPWVKYINFDVLCAY